MPRCGTVASIRRRSRLNARTAMWSWLRQSWMSGRSRRRRTVLRAPSAPPSLETVTLSRSDERRLEAVEHRATNGQVARAEQVQQAAHDDQPRLPGRLIIVEGIDGSGKSTQLDLLRKWLVNQGYLVIFSEWNSSPIVKGITRGGKRQQLLTPMTFSLIPAADFASRTYSQ